MSLRHKELKKADRLVLTIGIALGVATLILLFLFDNYEWIAFCTAGATLFAFFFWAGIDYADRAITKREHSTYAERIKEIIKEG